MLTFDDAIQALFIVMDEKDKNNGAPTTNALLAKIAYERLITAEEEAVEQEKIIKKQTSEINDRKLADSGGDAAYYKAKYENMLKAHTEQIVQLDEENKKLLNFIVELIPHSKRVSMVNFIRNHTGHEYNVGDRQIGLGVWFAEHEQKISAVRALRDTGRNDMHQLSLKDVKEAVEDYLRPPML
jgi:DNA-directed RNA polymerase subunit L